MAKLSKCPAYKSLRRVQGGHQNAGVPNLAPDSEGVLSDSLCEETHVVRLLTSAGNYKHISNTMLGEDQTSAGLAPPKLQF